MREERMTNYYTLLELLPTATAADIKKSWHEQIQVWHPDRFTHAPALHRKAEARTQLINQAYQTLSDPIARTRYDATRGNDAWRVSSRHGGSRLSQRGRRLGCRYRSHLARSDALAQYSQRQQLLGHNRLGCIGHGRCETIEGFERRLDDKASSRTVLD